MLLTNVIISVLAICSCNAYRSIIKVGRRADRPPDRKQSTSPIDTCNTKSAANTLPILKTKMESLECQKYHRLSAPKHSSTKYCCFTADLAGSNPDESCTMCYHLKIICCSEFRTTDDRSGIPDTSSSNSIEGHENIGLLPQDCGKINGDRIIGGTIANLYEFPWMALISHRTRGRPGKDNLQFKCGGSIINSRYILTAAHCVVDKKLAGVRVGEFDISSKEDCQGDYPNNYCEGHIQDIIIEESIPHKDYQRSPVKNDIALLRVKKPINFSHKNAAPICLPLVSNLRKVILDDKIATVAGWGTTDTGSESAVLRKVDIPILTKTACRDLYNKNSANSDTTLNKLCAGELSKDSCSGDSGGPLMLENEVNGAYKMIQYGIVSYGPKQCGSLFPGVYTDVTSYIEWILDNIKA